MENNEISMFMDVKLDIYERKSEASKFKSWTKCLVKIESIKCFPCYIRLTFVKDIQDEHSYFHVRINIPGLLIRSAISRTKQYSYGLFWKHNRKRCCIFFALDTLTSYERHMKWMKKSIKNLELYRQEFIETRRNSRYNTNENNKMINQFDKNDDKNFKTNLQDILGPLPKIPDISESNNWSRRVSGFSGIYEEIPDIEHQQSQNKRSSRRVSRISVASGIYEEMKPIQQDSNFKPICENDKPPLPPPRKRINTLENGTETIPRCNTNPECEMAKKKKYLQVFETVFGRSKRSASVSETEGSTKDNYYNNSPTCGSSNGSNCGTPKTKRRKNRIFNIDHNIKLIETCKKRNSFSSPDLTNINYLDEFEDLICIDSLSSDYGDSNTSIDDLKIEKDEEIILQQNHTIKNNKKTFEKFNFIENDSETDLNISELIQPNFNFSCNTSTVNLVGSNLNNQTIPKLMDDDLSGYCIMAPIKKNQQSQDPLNVLKNDEVDDHEENKKKFIEEENIIENRKHFTDSGVYENMNPVIEYSLIMDKGNDENKEQKQQNEQEQIRHIYQNIENVISNKKRGEENQTISSQTDEKIEIISTENIENDNCINNLNKSKEKIRKSINFDDKIPSYYPNDYCDILGKCCRRRSSSTTSNNNLSDIDVSFNKNKIIKRRNNFKTIENDENSMKSINKNNKRENLYISSPLKIMEHRRKLNLNRKCHNELIKSSSLSSSSLLPPPPPPPPPSSSSSSSISLSPLRACKIEKNMYKVTKLTENSLFITQTIQNLKSSTQLSQSTNQLINNEKNKQNQLNLNQLNKISLNKQKYATLDKLSSSHNNYFDKSPILNNFEKTKCNTIQTTTTIPKITSKSTTNSPSTDLGSIKKFASLPRLKKIDFSRLKLKINAVLQRHQSDGF